MDDILEYADDAKNVLDEFYEVDKILYVEGVDDIGFWGTLFDRYYNGSIEIIEVNGSENLKPYIDKIANNQITNAYVACDQDYNFFTNKIFPSKIICTFGHSIENTLFCKESIVDLVKGYAKFHKKDLIRLYFDDWISEFNCLIKDLVYSDIYNEKYKLGHSILGDSCDRFFKGKKSYIISEIFISEYVANFFNEEALINIRAEMSHLEGVILSNFIRGHFLFSAAMRFVTQLSTELSTKKVSIAKDSFFATMLVSFEKNLDDHPHSNYYEMQIAKLS